MAQQVYCRNVYCKNRSERASTRSMKNKDPLYKCTASILIFDAADVEVGDLDRSGWGDYLQCLYFIPIESKEEDNK